MQFVWPDTAIRRSDRLADLAGAVEVLRPVESATPSSSETLVEHVRPADDIVSPEDVAPHLRMAPTPDPTLAAS
jgi:hypothetical protein